MSYVHIMFVNSLLQVSDISAVLEVIATLESYPITREALEVRYQLLPMKPKTLHFINQNKHLKYTN